MPSAHEFLTILAMVICVASVTTVVFQRLRQPVVLGYILAGLIVEAFAKQAHKRSSVSGQKSLMEIKHLLPGLGEPVPLRPNERSFAVGKTLAQLNVRGLTGASVLAIVRGEENVIMPSATEHLRVGDMLALVGTHEAVNAATVLLKKGQQEVQ